MDIDRLFALPFHQRHTPTTEEIRQWGLRRIGRFPLTDFITDGDLFFKTVWKMIDESKGYFWATTYAMDSSPAADTTLFKLTEAAKRGVHVVLFIDNVQYWAKQELIQKFQNCGGRFLLLNPQWTRDSIKGYLSRDIWRRHHEKLIVSDSWGLIGSANFENNYAGIRYGSCQFQDLNYLTEHVILDQYRQHFADTADIYGYNLHA
jgi:phosphatidylserine/phosphatidylglycerophosphate/cardiolipin synthase-like enzyme